MANITMYNPETKASGPVPIDKVPEALGDGLHPVDATVKLYNPETGKEGAVPAQSVHQALKDGLILSGSHAHIVATTGQLESGLRGAAQGATLGFGDEIAGGVKALVNYGNGENGSFGDLYRKGRDETRANDALAQEANPGTYLGGQLAGGLAGAFVPGLGAAKGATLLGRLGAGAAMGAANGVGASNSDLTQGDVGGVAEDAALGAGMGAGGQLLGEAVGKVGKYLASKAVSHLDPESQLAKAFGANTKDLDPIRGERFQAGIKHLEETGYNPKVWTTEGLHDAVQSDIGRVTDELKGHYAAANEAAPMFAPDLKKPLLDFKGIDNVLRAPDRAAAEAAAREIEDPIAIRRMVRDAQAKAIDAVKDPHTAKMLDIVKRADYGSQSALLRELESTAHEAEKAQNSVTGLWDMKKKLGEQVGPKWDLHQTPGSTMLKQRAYNAIRDRINTISSQLEKSEDPAIAGKFKDLTALNKTYNALESVDDSLARKLGRERANATPLGIPFRTAVSGLMAGSLTGSPVLSALSMGSNALANSTGGQLSTRALGHVITPARIAALGQHAQPGIGAAAQAAQPALSQTVAGPPPPPAPPPPPDPAAVRAKIALLPIQQRAKAMTQYNSSGQIPPGLFPATAAPPGPPTLSQMAQRMRQTPMNGIP